MAGWNRNYQNVVVKAREKNSFCSSQKWEEQQLHNFSKVQKKQAAWRIHMNSFCCFHGSTQETNKQNKGGKLVMGNKQKKKLLMGETKKWSPAVAGTQQYFKIGQQYSQHLGFDNNCEHVSRISHNSDSEPECHLDCNPSVRRFLCTHACFHTHN